MNGNKTPACFRPRPPFALKGGHYVDCLVRNAASLRRRPSRVASSFHNEKKSILGGDRRDTDINERDTDKPPRAPASWEVRRLTSLDCFSHKDTVIIG